MSARVIVALGIGALLLILLGTLIVGDAVGIYFAVIAIVAVAALVWSAGHRHPDDALPGL